MSNWPLSVMHTIEHCTAYTDCTLFRIKMSWHQSKHTHINMSYTEPLSFVQSRLNYIKCSLISSSIFRFFNIHFAGYFIRCMLPVHQCTALHCTSLRYPHNGQKKSGARQADTHPTQVIRTLITDLSQLSSSCPRSTIPSSGLDIKISDTINRTTYINSSLVDLFTHLCIRWEGICIWYQAHFWGFILVGQLVNPGGYLNANHLSFYSEFACSFFVLGWSWYLSEVTTHDPCDVMQTPSWHPHVSWQCHDSQWDHYHGNIVTGFPTWASVADSSLGLSYIIIIIQFLICFKLTLLSSDC